MADAALTQSVHSFQHHYACMAQAIEFLYANRTRQPSLTELSQAIGFSPTYLQRLFAQWAGVSPKRFLQVLSAQHACELLAQNHDTLDVMDELGLTSSSRLHDLLISCEALSPAQIRSQGQGLSIEYGWADTPFGEALLGWTDRGICYLVFTESDRLSSASALSELQNYLPNAALSLHSAQAQRYAETIFHQFRKTGCVTAQPGRLHLLLKGTNFQIKVWQALIRLGDKPLVSYQQLSTMIGQPSASRAVASAIGHNCIGWLIPCHRVIRQHGEFGEYRWGAERKRVMLAWEMTHSAQA